MNNVTEQAKRWRTVYLFGVFLMALLVWTNGCSRAREKERAFEQFFSSVPPSVQFIEYRYDRSVFGDGSYVLVFKCPEAEIRTWLGQQGYTTIGIETDPNHWRLDLCNSIVHRLVKINVKIDQTFDCYSKETNRKRVRIFYDKSKNLAVLLGVGNFSK